MTVLAINCLVNPEAVLIGGRLPAGIVDQLATRLNQLSRWYPRPALWLLLGAVALAWRRPRGALTLVSLALAALLVVVLNALGLFADPHFVLPVAPAFVLFGCGGLLDGADWRAFQAAGARAGMIYSALVFRGPLAAALILHEAEGLADA